VKKSTHPVSAAEAKAAGTNSAGLDPGLGAGDDMLGNAGAGGGLDIFLAVEAAATAAAVLGTKTGALTACGVMILTTGDSERDAGAGVCDWAGVGTGETGLSEC